MKPIVGIAFAAIGLVAASITVPSLWLPTHSPTLAKTKLVGVSLHEKTQARLIQAAETDGQDAVTTGIVQFAQAMGPFWDGPGPFFGREAPPFGPPPHGPDAQGPFGFAQPPSPRADCENRVDRLAGVVGYLKSKERLQGDQRAVWQKVEAAAEPGLARIRDLCEELPTQAMQPPGLLARVDFALKDMTARAELLRAIRDPLQALYDTLSADQRALLDVPPPPPRRLPPSPRRLPPPPGDTL